MKSKKLGLIAIALLLLSFMTGVATLAVSEASEELSSYMAAIYADGGGIVTCEFAVYATGTADEVGATQIVIQRKNGSNWITAQAFTRYAYSNLIGNNCLVHSSSVSYSGTIGQQYRAVVTMYAKIGSGSTSRSYTTNTVIA
jgi:hypothetical protein